MQQNLVSIITPSYNSARFVEQTIRSVQAQTYHNWELIIVNDGSRDNSPQIIERYASKDSRIQLITQINGGSASARNNGLRNAKGRYICFLDSDDVWDDNFLKSQLAFIKDKNAALVYASYNRMDIDGKLILKPFIVPEKVDYKALLKTCSISCLTAMYDKEIVGERFFREELKSMRDDYVFWLTILKDIDYGYGNEAILASYRIMTQSTTGNKKKVIKPQFNVYYKIEKLGLMRSIYYLGCWAIISFFKYR